MNSNNPYHFQDFLADLKNWWKTCPLFTKALIYFCSILCIVALTFDFSSSIVNQPGKTIGQLHLARLFISPFAFHTLAELLLAFLFYLPMASDLERENGTLKTIIDFFFKNLEINLLFIGVCYLLAIISDSFLFCQAFGLWGIYFAQLTEKSLENSGESISLWWLPFQIPSKYYVPIQFVLFSIVSNTIRVDILAAILAGFINYKFFNLFYMGLLDRLNIADWEASPVIGWLRNLPNYVSYGSLSGPLMSNPDMNPNYPPIGDFGKSSNAQITFERSTIEDLEADSDRH